MTQETVHDSTTDSQATEEMPTAGHRPTPPGESIPPTRPTRSFWPNLLLALLLVVTTAGVTYLLTTEQETEAATDTTVSQSGEGSAQETPFVPGEEPVADAAAVIIPSVVQIRTVDGVGSGVVYDSSGLILTAAHVVAGNDTVTVRLDDGEQVEGTVLGGTTDADVAVVQVERDGLPTAELALDDEPRVGQMAIAVGSPWGLQGTVTAGIISAVDQSVRQGTSARALLQTDAAINPGNSGGPLVDREGRVLGINVSIFSLSGANDGVGFAVPIDIAYDVAQRVIAGEDIEQAFLGVAPGDDVESGRAGAVVGEVTEGSAAAAAGLEVGDLVISLDGARIQSFEDLAAQVTAHQPGDTVEVVVVRDGEEVTLTATLGTRPPAEG